MKAFSSVALLGVTQLICDLDKKLDGEKEEEVSA
jgi:hypothetical protein